MTSGVSAARRRVAAVGILDAGAAGHSVWARGSVWLLRLALEHALRDLWRVRAPELADASMRAQLLVLPKYLDAEAAWNVDQLWRALSRVGHHHAYELTPTRGEILTWRQAVETALEAIEQVLSPIALTR